MIKKVKGFKDILHEENKLREKLIERAKNFFELNGFKQITTPILEKTELFVRSIGESTDIVQKEMFTFQDKSGEFLSLRPEGTAPVVRAFIENSLYARGALHKFYYYGPMFRRERPQKGRLRQFHQIGIECFGSNSPFLDAHVIFILEKLLEELKVKNVTIEVNSIGCKNCRPEYQKELISYLEGNRENLCSDCQDRLNRNPLRVLDCKNEKCRNVVMDAPKITDYLCPECEEHFNRVIFFLEKFNVNFNLNPMIVRGLDYYTKTVFEAISTSLGGQNAVGAGGRYDSLVKEIGGKDIPGIGFALGLERILLLTEEKTEEKFVDVFLIILGDEAVEKGIEIYKNLIENGFYTEFDYELGGLKKQLKKADKLNAEYAVIIGEDELKEGKILVRNLKESSQEKVALENLIEKLRS